jgi:predicted nucleotidyltransferase
MIALLESKRQQIAALCQRYRVRRLEVFGSASSEHFDPQSSDVDFLVDFYPLTPGESADAYFGLREALESLLGRSVDLVMVRAITNRYFLKAIEGAREVLYAA